MAEKFDRELIKKIASEHEYYCLTQSPIKSENGIYMGKKYKITFFAETFEDMSNYAAEADHTGEVVTKSQFQKIIDLYLDPAYTDIYTICIDDSLLKPEKKNIDGIDPNVAYTITGLVEKGIITFDEGNFMYDHIRNQHRMEYTFEKESYTVTIKLHEKRK